MTIKILSTALQDMQSGLQFYERQNAGLGEYFLDSLFADIDSLALFAGIHRKFKGYHRLLAGRFPYAVYYKLNGGMVEVWRV